MSHPHGGSGASQHGFPSYRRPSTYAAVLSGSNSSQGQQQQQNPPTRSISHLLNAVSQPPTHQPTYPSRRDMEGNQHMGLPAPWLRGGSSGDRTLSSNWYGPASNLAFSPSILDPMVPTFFVPSYLRGSRHAERLQETHRARVSSQREARERERSHPASAGGSLSTSSSSINLHKMVPSHRGMTHDIIERAPVSYLSSHDDTPAPLPSRWSEMDKWQGLDVQGDGLANGCEVRFAGLPKGSAADDSASIRADHPIPRECGIYYFEVTVVSKGKEGLIGIGLSAQKVALNRLPGWEPDSYGYHGDDGYAFRDNSTGKQYGPKFASGDVVGCAINFRTGVSWFTKNGNALSIAFTGVKTDKPLYPSVGVKKTHEHLRVNFGQTPFVYDIDKVMREEREAIRADIQRTSSSTLHTGLDENSLIHQLIAQYLGHDGYVETARAFASEVREESRTLAGNEKAEELDLEEDMDAENRQRIRAAILDGDIDKALKHTNAYYPSVLKDNENIYFKLRCRKYIEMIRRGEELRHPSSPSLSVKSGKKAHSTHSNSNAQNSQDYGDVFDGQMELDEPANSSNGHKQAPSTLNTDSENITWDPSPDRMDISTPALPETTSAAYNSLLVETIQYGQELKSEFSGDPRREVKKALEDTLALIAYPEPRESPLAGLMSREGRKGLSEEVGGAILVSLGKSSSAALERLCQQTEILVSELAGDGGAGAFVNVKRDFLQ